MIRKGNIGNFPEKKNKRYQFFRFSVFIRPFTIGVTLLIPLVKFAGHLCCFWALSKPLRTKVV